MVNLLQNPTSELQLEFLKFPLISEILDGTEFSAENKL